jgi:hypothetical protein
MPLVEVPDGTPETTSKTSAEVALVVPLMVSPMIEAAVGEITLFCGVLAALPVGTWTIQVVQVPEGIQDKTPVAAPPSVDKTLPAEPSATGRIYVTAVVVVLEAFRVVNNPAPAVSAKTNDPWVVPCKPRVAAPADETLKFEVVMVRALAPRVQVEGEAPVKFKAPEELTVTTPEPEPMLLVLVDVKVVNAPVLGVEAPMAVVLIPVDVVLKWLEVMVRSLAPVLMEEAERPERAKAPDVAVRFNAPVVKVKPLEAVSNPADVIVPEPVVEMFPEVERVPSSLMVNFETPPDWTSIAVLVPALVSFRIKAVAVPCWVRVKDWSVAVSAKVKAMFLASVVVMVLPEVAS